MTCLVPNADRDDLEDRGAHRFELDSEQRGEGLCCLHCGITEAELDGTQGTDPYTDERYQR